MGKAHPKAVQGWEVEQRADTVAGGRQYDMRSAEADAENPPDGSEICPNDVRTKIQKGRKCYRPV